MTLPVSGAISFNNINVELGVAGTTQASLGQTSYRNLAGVASGAISMSNFYGKANQFAFTISSNQTNANLRTLAVNAGWNQSSKVVATINSGVYVGSNSTGTPALTVNGSFPGGVELVNNGYIVGMGGAGGAGQGSVTAGGGSGGNGGLALSVSVAVSITNNNTIGGGGGGGGGGASGAYPLGACGSYQFGGGGGGGGRSSTTNSAAGAGGPAMNGCTNYSGSAGGAGTSAAAGNGGNGGGPGGGGCPFYVGGRGGNGGGWGSSGSGGGGVGMILNQQYPALGGGGGGGAVSGNSNITWVATGTRLGSIS